MKKKLKEFKTEFLNEISKHTNCSEELKAKIGIRGNNQMKKGNFKFNKRSIFVLAGAVLATCLILVVSVVSIINYRNTPVYESMKADNLQSVQKLAKRRLAGEIDEVIEDIGVITLPGISCYAKPSEEIIVTINISNPKSFEILSFTLNNYKYQSYEFEYGSNSNQIFVRFKCGEVSGVEEITIDAIKYVDGTSIKDVRFDGERTIKVGVTYQNVPNVSDVSAVALKTNFTVTLNAEDKDLLMDEKTGLCIYLFYHDTSSGEEEITLVRSAYLNLGFNLVPYSNLRLGSTYTYYIVGVFDLLDGQGKRANILHSDTFTTEEGFNFSEFDATYDGATFNFTKLDDGIGTLTKLKIYDLEDELVNVETPNLTGNVISGLKSNTEYKLVLGYEYDLVENGENVKVTKEFEYLFKTNERPEPTVEVVNITEEQEKVTFNYEINDTTEVGKVLKVALYKKLADETYEFVKELEGEVKEITELLSNNDYKIVVTYEYDLLDGTGTKTKEVEATFKTLAKTAPTYTLKDIVTFQEKVTFAYDVEDIDNIARVVKFDIMKNEEVVKTISSTDALEFDELLTNNEYKIVLHYEYDLNDGEGIMQGTTFAMCKTEERVAPIAKFTQGFKVASLVVAKLEIEDIEGIYQFDEFKVFINGEEQEVTCTQKLVSDKDGIKKYDVEIKGLDASVTSLKIYVVYHYDLNDGEGVQTVGTDHPTADNSLVIEM